MAKYLQIAQTRLTEFKLSSSVFNLSPVNVSSFRKNLEISEPEQKSLTHASQILEVKAITCTTIEKLKIIEEILTKYKNLSLESQAEVDLVSQADESLVNTSPVQHNEQVTSKKAQTLPNKSNKLNSAKKLASRTPLDEPGIIPRSINRTLEKLKRDLNPNADLEVIQDFRKSRYRTIVSLRYLLILFLAPLLVNQFSKVMIVNPLMNTYWHNSQSNIFLNSSQEERALAELKSFEEKIRFDFLAGKTLGLTPQVTEEKLKEKVVDIAQKYRSESNNAVKNIFADICSVATFAILIVTGKQQIAMLKSFIDEIIYGLSDSAKAFLIILSTDLFVGFHSSHGWEVILENFFKHFGLPENKSFIFMFIATFPVVLDVIFKYWIFRYLNRISPSAVATYRNMNE